jgi:dienelactone hydrolase
MSYHSEGGYINKFLASHGYIVVAVDYPLTNFFAPGGAYLADVVNQPGDVSYVIDQVLQRNQQEGDSLYQQVDAKRIGTLGLSLGGMTTILVTFDGRLQDPRIKAAVAIAGPAAMFNRKFFTSRDVPFMMIGGTSDQLVPYELNARPILEKDPDSILVSLDMASHGAFAGVAVYLMRFANHPDKMACHAIRDGVARNDHPLASLVSDEYGVLPIKRERFCDNVDDLPRAMRAGQQHMLTTLSVFSFFESQFNPDKKQRIKALNFLLNILPEENSDVQVEVNN